MAQFPLEYKLRGPAFLNPHWFTVVSNGVHEGEVTPFGDVKLLGETLMFADPARTLEPGTRVKVGLVDGHFACCPHEQWTSYLDKREAQRLARQASAKQELDAARDEAKAFNARLRLPVAWTAGQKDVLFGLSEHSWGDGRSRRSVTHVLLLEPLSEGRLVRKANDFLCTSASGSNGKRWSSARSESVDGDGQLYASRVTCQGCLELARRWMVD